MTKPTYFTPEQEFDHITALYGREKEVLELIKSNLQILQTRSQTILGLCTICLTITGFSGPRIAESGKAAAASIVGGLFFIVAATFFLVSGPLRLQWITRTWAGNWKSTALLLLERRNKRTRLFTVSSFCLIVGMGLYMTGLGLYLFSF